ncbi:hypothetical protein [Pontibacter oryzae]|uniref:T9SS C-terminal target domain-containing protein n=1 Tax=Pontibacter oryzae TaxID=2304593 RepID=A0A399SIP1_9BACT|nr:hypothetical protein [Pontibacter oryzae]RIJ42363.1 hypothetical protein D1627_00375 [Pontibacter oryzae]
MTCIKPVLTLSFVLCGLFFSSTTFAQSTATSPVPQDELAQSLQQLGEKETLSGINLVPGRNGTYQLDFSQQLEEDATLQVKNTAGRLVYQKPLEAGRNRSAWRYQLGKLKPDTYLIEVKTSDTTYWTKFRVK